MAAPAPEPPLDAPRLTIKRQKRLVLLCQHFYPEMISTGLHMTELATALRDRGWVISVVCAPPQLDRAAEGRTISDASLPGIRIHRLRSLGSHHRGLLARGIFAGLFTARTVIWLLRNRRDYDGVLVTTNPPFLGAAPLLVRPFTGRQYALLVYDVYPDIAEALGAIRKGGLLARLWRVGSRTITTGAARIIVIGRDMQKLVARGIAREAWHRIRLIPNWSDERNVHPIEKEANTFIDEMGLRGRIVIQYAGRLGSTHNLEPLVDAAAQLTDLPVIIQIIGGGPKAGILRHRAEAIGARNVQFLGYQPHDRLDEVLSAADVAVVCLGAEFTGLSVPSKTYGILASGKPVVALLERDSEIGMLIEEEQCGIVLPNATANDVVGAIRTLLADPTAIRSMSDRARLAFVREYTLSLAARRYDECLFQAFGEPGDLTAAPESGPTA